MSKYLNIYEVGQAYGGPEEGGWWYSCGSPMESTLVVNLAHSQRVCKLLNDRFRKTTRGYSMGYGDHDGVDPEGFGDDDYLMKGGQWGDKKLRARIEDHPAEAFPQERPHYE